MGQARYVALFSGSLFGSSLGTPADLNLGLLLLPFPQACDASPRRDAPAWAKRSQPRSRDPQRWHRVSAPCRSLPLPRSKMPQAFGESIRGCSRGGTI